MKIGKQEDKYIIQLLSVCSQLKYFYTCFCMKNELMGVHAPRGYLLPSYEFCSSEKRKLNKDSIQAKEKGRSERCVVYKGQTQVVVGIWKGGKKELTLWATRNLIHGHDHLCLPRVE